MAKDILFGEVARNNLIAGANILANAVKATLGSCFINDKTSMHTELEGPYILLYDKKISNVHDLLHLLEEIAKKASPCFWSPKILRARRWTSLCVKSSTMQKVMHRW